MSEDLRRLIKGSCRYATTAPINLATNNLNPVDTGAIVANDRIFVKDQTDPKENGIYLAKNGVAWVRSDDFNQDEDVLSGCKIHILEGSLNTNRVFKLITDDPIGIGTSNLIFEEETDYVDLMDSPCIIMGGIGSWGLGVINTTASVVLLRVADVVTAELRSYNIPAQILALPLADTLYYIFVEYNAGTPQFALRTSPAMLSDGDTQEFYIGSCMKNAGGDVWLRRIGLFGGSNANHMDRALRELTPFKVTSDRNRITMAGTKVRINAGMIWNGYAPTVLAAFDSSLADIFAYWHYDTGLGDWVITPSVDIDVVNYNDSLGGALAVMTNGKCDYVFRDAADGSVHIVYGQEDVGYSRAGSSNPYTQLPVQLPNYIRYFCEYAGKILINAATSTAVAHQLNYDFSGSDRIISEAISETPGTGAPHALIATYLNSKLHSSFTADDVTDLTTTPVSITGNFVNTLYVCDTSGLLVPMIIDLPSVVNANGRQLRFFIKNATQIVVLTPSGGETIGGQAFLNCNFEWQTITLIADEDNTDWVVIKTPIEEFPDNVNTTPYVVADGYTNVVFLVDTTAAPIVFNLPVEREGTKLHIKLVAGANPIAVTPAVGTIDGAAVYNIVLLYEAITVYCDGVNWFIL